MKTTGDLRKELASCFVQARQGKLVGDALRGVIGCANQINASLATEVRARAQMTKEEAPLPLFGDMPIVRQAANRR